MKCSTCGIRVSPQELWIKFACPSCGEETIVRCERCKRLVNTYTCPKCGFTGP